MKTKHVPILYEDDAIIVCEKPIGMPTQSDHSRDMDLETYIKHYLFEKQEGEEEPYLAVAVVQCVAAGLADGAIDPA